MPVLVFLPLGSFFQPASTQEEDFGANNTEHTSKDTDPVAILDLAANTEQIEFPPPNEIHRNDVDDFFETVEYNRSDEHDIEANRLQAPGSMLGVGGREFCCCCCC